MTCLWDVLRIGLVKKRIGLHLFIFSVSGDFVEWALLLCRGLDQQRAWSGDISLRK
jgi:hypothetical protein